MFKSNWVSQHKAIFRSNKPLQLIALLIGVALLSNSALAARKQPSNTAAPTAVQEIGNGKEADCNGHISSPAKLIIPVGKSTLIKLPEPLASRSIANPDVVQAKLISPKTLYLLGVNIGTTNMIIRSADGTCTVIDVMVNMDPDALQETLSALMPDEKNIKVTAAADSLILSGTVEDALTASRVVEIAEAYVRRQAAESAQNLGVDTASGAQGATVVSFSQGQNSQSAQGIAGRSPRVVNLLSVGSQQQVMLEVKVAEVSKTLLDKLGAAGVFGGDKFKLLTPFFATATSIFGTPSTLPNGPTIGSTTGKGISIDAEKKDGLVKILAEPNIMAISGQEGSFLAGGTIFIPVTQQSNGVTSIILQEKAFGVGVIFTPTVLAGGRINLKVAPEVSELSREGVTSSTGAGTAIFPAFTVRRASTTVQLMDGQSFAIGGLIKNNTTATIKAFPILGEIPILGALFRSTSFQNDKTELIFIVTPHLVKPLVNNAYRLPTDRYVDPSRADIFLGGKLEGKLPPDAPLPVSPDEQSDALKPSTPAQASDTGFDMR